MAKTKKIFNVPDELIPTSSPAISVTPTQVMVTIPQKTIAWKLGDVHGFVNRAGLQAMIDHNPGLEYDETQTQIPRAIGFKTPFGGGGKACKGC